MNTSLPFSVADLPTDMPAAAQASLRMLQRLRRGSLTLELPGGCRLHLGSDTSLSASMRLRNWNVFAAVLRSGDIGLAETYIEGDWSTPDLAGLFCLLLANRDDLQLLVYGSWWGRLLYRLRHLLRRNTRANSRRNIQAHYDLGNEFYALWLDHSMNYSSAWFEGDYGGDLTRAQQAKMRRALRSAQVQPGSRVLEIGCGWGALAEVAARDFQAQVTGVTLSEEQLVYGQARMQRAGLAGQVNLRLQDYRDIQDGPYDAICSIEMVEAVGQEYWPAYFGSLRRLLKPGGRACVQSIVIADDLFDRYVQGTDFIQQYIFPGGCLPSPSRFRAAAEDSGLRVEEEFAFGADYAETLRRWRQRFVQQRRQVLLQGFDQPFLRAWQFYLAYCEAAFAMKNIDVVQYTLLRD